MAERIEKYRALKSSQNDFIFNQASLSAHLQMESQPSSMGIKKMPDHDRQYVMNPHSGADQQTNLIDQVLESPDLSSAIGKLPSLSPRQSIAKPAKIIITILGKRALQSLQKGKRTSSMQRPSKKGRP